MVSSAASSLCKSTGMQQPSLLWIRSQSSRETHASPRRQINIKGHFRVLLRKLNFSQSALEQWLPLPIIQISGAFSCSICQGRNGMFSFANLRVTVRKLSTAHSTSQSVFRKGQELSIPDQERSEHNVTEPCFYVIKLNGMVRYGAKSSSGPQDAQTASVCFEAMVSKNSYNWVYYNAD